MTNFSNPNLVAAATGLQPARLRFGGSGADNLVYGLSPGSPECGAISPAQCAAKPDYTTPGCLNASHWERLRYLATASGSEFIFGVSYNLLAACAAGAQYSWNSTNAQSLLAYLAAHGESVWGVELGNELNNQGGSPCNLAPAGQASAARELARLLAATLPGTKLVGPDTGYLFPQTWLRGYLPAVGSALHAVTHHVYNGLSRSNYNSPEQLDSPLAEIAWYTKLAALAPGAEIWAGENGPIGGGNDGTCGAHSVCGTFATVAWYADDMALRAKFGFKGYQRQDLFGCALRRRAPLLSGREMPSGSPLLRPLSPRPQTCSGAYGLTTSESGAMALGAAEPILIRPDYWVNFLWKRTLGPQVLNATSSSAMVRAYAFAGAPASPFAAAECGAGAGLQQLLMNLNNASTAAVALPPAAGAGAYAAWVLSPPGGDAFATTALLNAAPLPARIDAASEDPAAFLRAIPVPAARGSVAGGLTLPALGTAFVCY